MTPEEYERINVAVTQWFVAKAKQEERARLLGRLQGGTRDRVLGGGHLEGFEELLVDEITSVGAKGLHVTRNQSATLAGWYRSSKSWDLLVTQWDEPILAVEFKSMEGSEGKNLNNRADEMYGVAEDARQAQEHGILPRELRRAYVFIMEDTPSSTRPVDTRRLFGRPDPIFEEASYLDRMAIMLSRMRDSGLYHLVWAVAAVRDPIGYYEPDLDVGWDEFAADLRSGFHRGQAQVAPHA